MSGKNVQVKPMVAAVRAAFRMEPIQFPRALYMPQSAYQQIKLAQVLKK